MPFSAVVHRPLTLREPILMLLLFLSPFLLLAFWGVSDVVFFVFCGAFWLFPGLCVWCALVSQGDSSGALIGSLYGWLTVQFWFICGLAGWIISIWGAFSNDMFRGGGASRVWFDWRSLGALWLCFGWSLFGFGWVLVARQIYWGFNYRIRSGWESTFRIYCFFGYSGFIHFYGLFVYGVRRSGWRETC